MAWPYVTNLCWKGTVQDRENELLVEQGDDYRSYVKAYFVCLFIEAKKTCFLFAAKILLFFCATLSQ